MRSIRAARERLNPQSVVVITGASSGIGAATAIALAPSGATFVLLARRADQLTAVAERVRAAGGRAEAVPTDLRDAAAVQALARHVLVAYGAPDLVIANAGHSITRTVLDNPDRFHDVERLTRTNFLGHVALLLPLLPAMSDRRRGRIVYVSTFAARVPIPGWSAYSATKGAFDLWLRAVAPELRRHGVRTTTVELPLVQTGMIVPTYGHRSPFAISLDRAVARVARATFGPRDLIAPWWGRLAGTIAGAAPVLTSRVVGFGSLRRWGQ